MLGHCPLWSSAPPRRAVLHVRMAPKAIFVGTGLRDPSRHLASACESSRSVVKSPTCRGDQEQTNVVFSKRLTTARRRLTTPRDASRRLARCRDTRPSNVRTSCGVFSSWGEFIIFVCSPIGTNIPVLRSMSRGHAQEPRFSCESHVLGDQRQQHKKQISSGESTAAALIYSQATRKCYFRVDTPQCYAV